MCRLWFLRNYILIPYCCICKWKCYLHKLSVLFLELLRMIISSSHIRRMISNLVDLGIIKSILSIHYEGESYAAMINSYLQFKVIIKKYLTDECNLRKNQYWKINLPDVSNSSNQRNIFNRSRIGKSFGKKTKFYKISVQRTCKQWYLTWADWSNVKKERLPRRPIHCLVNADRKEWVFPCPFNYITLRPV